MTDAESDEIPVETDDEDLVFPYEDVELRIRGPRIGIWTLIDGIEWGSSLMQNTSPGSGLVARAVGPTVAISQDIVQQYREIDDIDKTNLVDETQLKTEAALPLIRHYRRYPNRFGSRGHVLPRLPESPGLDKVRFAVSTSGMHILRTVTSSTATGRRPGRR